MSGLTTKNIKMETNSILEDSKKKIKGLIITNFTEEEIWDY